MSFAFFISPSSCLFELLLALSVPRRSEASSSGFCCKTTISESVPYLGHQADKFASVAQPDFRREKHLAGAGTAPRAVQFWRYGKPFCGWCLLLAARKLSDRRGASKRRSQ
ncbi:hypothetical protein RRG08_051034 [Elysia crispata]|uniref:Secreted protein n=1 Tax=Elysia crispata TaxID=231223 RepID=A0AAE0Z6C5_9GAST|nr:hypothetical protein RRG08_051034 [Elysia crispata]